MPGSAETLPFEDWSFDLIISDHGAMSWADPSRTVPEAARVLRPGGKLIFCATSVLMLIAGWNDESVPTDQLERDYFGLDAISEGEDGAVTFSRPHGEWIALFRDNGLSVESFLEPRPDPDAVTTLYPKATVHWARRWPAEMIWVVRKDRADSDLRQLQRAFTYHAWANAKLIDFSRVLPPEKLKLTATGTLGSIERTLTHLVSSEQFYLRDLTGEDPSQWIESLVASIDELAVSTEENSRRWTTYIHARRDPDESYVTNWRGKRKNVIRWGTLIQALNHGTEHRTHVCTVLGANGIEPPDISVGTYEDEVLLGKSEPAIR